VSVLAVFRYGVQVIGLETLDTRVWVLIRNPTNNRRMTNTRKIFRANESNRITGKW